MAALSVKSVCRSSINAVAADIFVCRRGRNAATVHLRLIPLLAKVIKTGEGKAGSFGRAFTKPQSISNC